MRDIIVLTITLGICLVITVYTIYKCIRHIIDTVKNNSEDKAVEKEMKMQKNCWNCKYCINDYNITGTMDCKQMDKMTEEEINDYYTEHGGENCTYWEELYSE